MREAGVRWRLSAEEAVACVPAPGGEGNGRSRSGDSRRARGVAAGGVDPDPAGVRVAATSAGVPEVAVRVSRLPGAVEPVLRGRGARVVAAPDPGAGANDPLRAGLDDPHLPAQRGDHDRVLRCLAPAALHPEGAGQALQVQQPLARHQQQGVPVPQPDPRQRVLEPGQRLRRLVAVRSRHAVDVRQRASALRRLPHQSRVLRAAAARRWGCCARCTSTGCTA